MKYFDWDEGKNVKLKEERGISFADIQIAFEEGRILDVIDHPNKEKYANQQMLIVEIEDYIYLVPFIEDEDKYFLKTIFPSRKMTKNYILERRKKS